jgi:hypothetical protein
MPQTELLLSVVAYTDSVRMHYMHAALVLRCDVQGAVRGVQCLPYGGVLLGLHFPD